MCSVLKPFLSTPSARRATCRLRQRQDWETHFYPRPPRGGRQYWVFESRTDPKFLSTPSARRATPLVHGQALRWGISIHALREEGDGSGQVLAPIPRKFLSTPSARRATVGAGLGARYGLFLSTPSARRATLHRGRKGCQREDFYPRPPRGGRP